MCEVCEAGEAGWDAPSGGTHGGTRISGHLRTLAPHGEIRGQKATACLMHLRAFVRCALSASLQPAGHLARRLAAPSNGVPHHTCILRPANFVERHHGSPPCQRDSLACPAQIRSPMACDGEGQIVGRRSLVFARPGAAAAAASALLSTRPRLLASTPPCSSAEPAAASSPASSAPGRPRGSHRHRHRPQGATAGPPSCSPAA